MAFRKIQQPAAVPDSPEKLLLDLPRRKIPDVLPHQQDLMRKYVALGLEQSDVALQLPTGSGKTLVGLLIAEWRRRKYNERIVYLVPTKQLVNQVVEQAEEKYGISVHGFTGAKKDYDVAAKANYKSGARIAVTTYSSLFNTNPYFDDAEIIILDDTHAAEQYISEMWTLRIDRTNTDHAPLHAALCALLKPLLEPYHYTRLTGETDDDRTWTDKIPTPELATVESELMALFDTHTPNTELAFPWQMIRGHLDASHLYFSSQEIMIRPLIPPTWTHAPFHNAKQRIYMSATLGAGGDLERIVGRAPITRLPVAEGWDIHGVGRRFFVFPSMSLDADEIISLRREMMALTPRSLVLVPNTRVHDEIEADIKANTQLTVFGVSEIEGSKDSFVNSSSATAIIANRYDGIDFPGPDCRLLFVDGLPRATNLQERFLMSRMGANALFNERIQTRVLQAIGRCTRSLEDYSAVIVSGGELVDYLADSRKREYFHPELQAELLFGVEQSREMSPEGLLENLRIFLSNGEEWEKVNQEIVASRYGMERKIFPAMTELQSSVAHEIEYQKKMWQKDFEAALIQADKVLAVIKSPDLRGYRALWHYLAGSAAMLAVSSGGTENLRTRAKDEFSRAKDAAPMLPWLVTLTRYSGQEEKPEEEDNTVIMEQVERMEATLSRLGTAYERPYVLREKEILEGVLVKDHQQFENAHKLLGEMLGFESDNKETEGAPDPWWISSKVCLVFEDHSDADENSALDIRKARQVSSHPAWMKKNIPAAAVAEILPVLVTPVSRVRAVPYLEPVAVWKVADFQTWATQAVAIIRELRTNLTTPGDLVWRAETAVKLKEHGFDAISLMAKLRSQRALDILKLL
jgi:hypothetical protein